MEFIQTGFAGLVEIVPAVFEDDRGYFFETYRKDIFEREGIRTTFVQSNQSRSRKGVVRGLHLQLPPHAQAKLVRVLQGIVLDVVVDCRKSSATFGKHFSCVLSGENRKMLFVPAGFAHGFAALEDSEFHYLCDDIYHRESEAGICWDDPELAIDWKVDDPLISEKDRQLPGFAAFNEINQFT